MSNENESKKTASWEKTVEWAYVRKYLSNAEFVAPIDGNYEISDAIFAQSDQWYLIEFKHTKSDFNSEREKYPNLSDERVYSILRNYDKYSKEEIDCIKKIDNKDRGSAMVEYELKLMGQENKDLDRSQSILLKAEKAYNKINSSYRQLKADSLNHLEPHFFVYSQQNNFDKLMALPYWTNWKDKNNSRGWKEFDAGEITDLGKNFDAFSDYVEVLATARGYDLERLEGEGKEDFKAVVFGRIYGFTRELNVTMTLDNFLSNHKELKVIYERKYSIVEEATATPSNSLGQSKP